MKLSISASMFILPPFILLVSISLIRAASLDESCQTNADCDNNMLVCNDRKCHCKTPWYTPCNSSCEINVRFANEGERCEVPLNCFDNMRCSENRCICEANYTSRNGLCFKRLGAACANYSECWSLNCVEGQCACRDGYRPEPNTIDCRRTLVKIYERFSQANENNEFCSDSTNCISTIAICDVESGSSRRFCQCPRGYRATRDRNQCDPIQSTLFSPLLSQPSIYDECGACQDENALCIKAANETTCWCRSGYEKSDEQCKKIERNRPLIIFPNQHDIQKHNFAEDCAIENLDKQIERGLCTCAPGYRFQRSEKTCVAIQAEWQNNILEYGVCTRIQSDGDAEAYNGLCPKPLRCETRRDKHVCSCGVDQFIEPNTAECVYFIGKNASLSNGKCPRENARRNNVTGLCECLDGYQVMNNNIGCEVTLSASFYNANCTSNQSIDAVCTSHFGRKARLCSPGECRCSGVGSFPNVQRTKCYAPINQTLVPPLEYCPPNSAETNNRCTCNPGFRPSNNFTTCALLQATLEEFQNNASSDRTDDWTDDDCQQFFSGPVEPYQAGRCQCKRIAFANANRTGCWYILNQTLPNINEGAFCPPNSDTSTGPLCLCTSAYRANGNTCEPRARQVYTQNDTNAQNTTEITVQICKTLFGLGSEKANPGLYCVCSNDAYPVRNNRYCHFYIGAVTNNPKGSRDCPDNSSPNRLSNGDAVCNCNSGYRVNPNNRTCDLPIIELVGPRDRPSTTSNNCTEFNGTECVIKFGKHSFCYNDKCYCDRRLSYANNNRCESLTNYIFPASHELFDHTCITDDDCANRDNVICANQRSDSDYKVCQCKPDFYLNPNTETCDNQRCEPACNTSQNFECRGDICECKAGYYRVGTTCMKNELTLQLYQTCNSTLNYGAGLSPEDNNNLSCDPNCHRATCIGGTRAADASCVQLQLENDKCFSQPEICQRIDKMAVCDRDSNQCLCAASYYRYENHCARAVNAACRNAEECGGEMLCESRKCYCNPNQRKIMSSDIYGRTMEICIKNGLDRIQSNILLFFIIAYLRFFCL